MKKLIEKYQEKLTVEFNSSDFHQHIMWMLDEIPNITDVSKQNRWLGFVQGYFWSVGFYTIDEMREHVREMLTA